VRVVPGRRHHRKLSNQKQVEKTEFECTYLNLRWFLMLLVGGQVGGQVGRWFVKIISRIHMFWHSSNMHEGYVRIIFNILKKNSISFLKKYNFFLHKKCEFILWNFECSRHRLHAMLNKKIKTWELLKQRNHLLFLNFSFRILKTRAN